MGRKTGWIALSIVGLLVIAFFAYAYGFCPNCRLDSPSGMLFVVTWAVGLCMVIGGIVKLTWHRGRTNVIGWMFLLLVGSIIAAIGVSQPVYPGALEQSNLGNLLTLVGGLMGIVGFVKIIHVGVRKPKLPTFVSEGGERLVDSWYYRIGGRLSWKDMYIVLTNKRILDIDVRKPGKEESVALDGIKAMAKNRRAITYYYGGRIDQYGNRIGSRRSETTYIGDIDFFKGNEIIFTLTGFPDVDSIVAKIEQLQSTR